MAVKTIEPTTSLSADISVSDLGKLIAGEDLPAAKPAAEPAASAPVVLPATETPVETVAPEAVAVETPAAEPVQKPEGEETTPEKIEEPKPETPEEKTEKEKKSWQDKRLKQLSSQRRQAEAARLDAEAQLGRERDRAERLERELAAVKSAAPGPDKPAADQPPADKPPATAAKKPVLKEFVAALKDGEEYETALERYTEAHADWARQQDQAERERQTRVQDAKTQKQIHDKDWEEALANPDYGADFEDTATRVVAATPEGLQFAISQLRQDDGKALWPAVTVYLDQHPEELAALSTQFQANPYAATAKLGRIAASLISPAKPVPPAPPAVTAPKPGAPNAPKKPAAKPPAAVGGASAPAPIDLNTADMNTFAREVSRLLPAKR